MPSGGLVSGVNAQRSANGLAPLRDGAYTGSAQSFAFTLCNSHAGGNLWHSGSAPGENVGWMYSSGGCVNDANGMVGAWMNSAPHRANILNPNFTVTGAGAACDGTNAYFVVQFG